MKVFVVLNPAAGQETQASVREALARRFDASHIPYEVHETVEGDRLGDIVRARLSNGFDLVVAVGGGSNVPLQVQADGDIVGTTPIEIEVVPGAVTVLVPEAAVAAPFLF